MSERQVAPSFRPSTTIPVSGVPIEVGTTIGLGEVTIESEDTPFLVTTMSRDNYFDLNREEFRGCGTKSPTEEAPLNVFDDVEYTKFCLGGGRFKSGVVRISPSGFLTKFPGPMLLTRAVAEGWVRRGSRRRSDPPGDAASA